MFPDMTESDIEITLNPTVGVESPTESVEIVHDILDTVSNRKCG